MAAGSRKGDKDCNKLISVVKTTTMSGDNVHPALVRYVGTNPPVTESEKAARKRLRERELSDWMSSSVATAADPSASLLMPSSYSLDPSLRASTHQLAESKDDLQPPALIPASAPSVTVRPAPSPTASTSAAATPTTDKHTPALTTAQKKANHVASEQRRRAGIRTAYEELSRVVPKLSDPTFLDRYMASTKKSTGGSKDSEDVDGEVVAASSKKRRTAGNIARSEAIVLEQSQSDVRSR